MEFKVHIFYRLSKILGGDNILHVVCRAVYNALQVLYYKALGIVHCPLFTVVVVNSNGHWSSAFRCCCCFDFFFFNFLHVFLALHLCRFISNMMLQSLVFVFLFRLVSWTGWWFLSILFDYLLNDPLWMYDEPIKKLTVQSVSAAIYSCAQLLFRLIQTLFRVIFIKSADFEINKIDSL